MFKVNNKDTRTTLTLTLAVNKLDTFSIVSIVDF